jgi:glycosyltransferase involved in cell wall biosynthesis
MLAQFYPPIIGGEERHVHNLSVALSRRGHDVSVATIWHKDLAPFQIDAGIRIHRLHGTAQRLDMLFSQDSRRFAPPLPDPGLMMRLSQISHDEKPDIVHAHNWMLHSYLPLKRLHGARLVVTLHDLSLVCATKTGMHKREPCSGPDARKCLRCASEHYGIAKGAFTAAGNWLSGAVERRVVDRFLPVSKAIALGNRLESGSTPYEIIPNFVPDDIGKLEPDCDSWLDQLPDQDYLLFVGDLTRLKGIHVLIEAYSTLLNAPPLVLIGRADAETPRYPPQNVSIFESWPHAAIMHAWSRCLFGIAPSILPDACPSVVMEAMSVGKPIIATRVGGMPDLVDHGRTGLLVPPDDVPALAEALRTLIDNPDLRADMAANSLRKVEDFKAGAVVPRIEKIYADVLTGHRFEAVAPCEQPR